MNADFPALVTAAWLAEHLEDGDVRVIDASWYLPQHQRQAHAEYLAGHVPGAVYFNIDEVVDPDTTLPHMLPSPERFASVVGGVGIGSDDTVIVYDGMNIFSAPRVWWMFRAFGHDRVAVLDGGLPAWTRAGYPLESGEVHPAPRTFHAALRPEMVRSQADVLDNLATSREQLVDARSAGRFAGTSPEPRPGLRGGHIPGSANVPFDFLVGADGTLVAPEAIRAHFVGAGIDPDQPIIASCGSGVTACVLALGLHVIGAKEVGLYDGSWSEWGLPGEHPVESSA